MKVSVSASNITYRKVPGPEKYSSAPNLGGGGAGGWSDLDLRRLYSHSLSQLKKIPETNTYQHKPSPFNLRWLHGYSPNPGVINLNQNGSTIVFYAASNCGVLYNWTANSMRILQGHRHMITCIATDASGKWLVTADRGPDNVVIVWDSRDCFPQRTLFQPHGSAAIAKVAMSADAKYLLTFAYAEKPTLYWWIWSFGLNEPHAKCSVDVPKHGVLSMAFNPYDSTQFMLITKADVWIGLSSKIFVIERGLLKETDDFQLNIRKIPKKIRPEHGKLTCFTFVEATCQVLVATSGGALLVFGYTIEYKENAKANNYELLKYIKPLKVETHKINAIKSIDNVIVTGNSAGEIHFYDEQVKLLYWVHNFHVDCVHGFSFNLRPRSYQIFDTACGKLCPCWERVVTEEDPETGYPRQKLLRQELPSDATTGGRPFLVRDFIVWTGNDGVGFVDFATEKLNQIMNNRTSPALSITVHPEKPLLCIGYTDGSIEMLNFLQHRLFARIDLRDHYKVIIPPKDDSIKCDYEISVPELSVTCLQHSPSGLHLACGLNTGQLLFLDATTLTIVTELPFHDTKHGIQEISFSPDSLMLATSDTGKTVCVYKYDCGDFCWTFIGKHRAHYQDISSVFFLPAKHNGEYKLLSVGMDRIMAEYDISASSDEYLEVLSLDRVEQTAVPLCGIVWPTPPDLNPGDCRLDLPMILLANNEHKYKIVNYETAMTLSTVLGPRYTDAVRRMQLVSTPSDDAQRQFYLLFATKDIIGLQKMPLDGNPWKHVGMLGHPVEVIKMCYREDLAILFTIGEGDCASSQWAANYRAPDLTTEAGGGELDPYYCLIENGRPGWLFQEVRDLFYYIQILCQGTFSPAMRRVQDYIPIDSLPDLMRALGFFPSEYEVENLIVEAKLKVYLKNPATELDFNEFVKLYLNHRPALGDSFSRLRDAFRTFASLRRDEFFMTRSHFIDMLAKYGECFSHELAWYLLSILWGHSFEERAAMQSEDFSFLPEKITFSTLVTNIMGIQELEDEADQQSLAPSHYSQGSTQESY